MRASDMQSDPLQGPASSGAFWTTVNAGEFLQGVPTPLSYSWFEHGTEPAVGRCFADLGVLTEREASAEPAPDDRFLSIFSGRLVMNVDRWRYAADRMPGSSGDGFEEHIFGAVRSGRHSARTRARYPAIVWRAPGVVARTPARLRDLHEAAAAWRLEALWALERDGRDAAGVLDQALDWFVRIVRHHTIAAMLAQGAFEQATRLANLAGRPELALAVAAGHASMEEATMLAELWYLAHAGLDLGAFALRYGYHGPNSGEHSEASWRENPRPVEILANRYLTMPPEQSPLARRAQRIAERERATAQLVNGVPISRRPLALGVLRMINAYMPLRELGRAALLMTIDVGRAAARRLGTGHAAAGRLDTPDDIFLFTHRELVDGHVDAGTARARREQRKTYQKTTLPDAWRGVPEPTKAAPQTKASTTGLAARVTGVPASGGTVEGIVQLVDDPSTADIEPGAILVCRTSDPSWASLFSVAGAAVIDIGSAMSHGAIVARELGIPCVINTQTGTSQLKTGDEVRVDGNAGTVDVLIPSQTKEPA